MQARWCCCVEHSTTERRQDTAPACRGVATVVGRRHRALQPPAPPHAALPHNLIQLTPPVTPPTLKPHLLTCAGWQPDPCQYPSAATQPTACAIARSIPARPSEFAPLTGSGRQLFLPLPCPHPCTQPSLTPMQSLSQSCHLYLSLTHKQRMAALS